MSSRPTTTFLAAAGAWAPAVGLASSLGPQAVSNVVADTRKTAVSFFMVMDARGRRRGMQEKNAKRAG
ncbi:hypothetical protein D3C87_1921710 [compost metagenome]